MESATEHQGRILLVDDESAILRTFRYCLEDEGYSVATANSAAQAEALLQRQVFDLCFLDLRLGEDNGLDVLAQMRIQAPWMRVVIVTAHSAVDTAVDAIQAGAADYLVKPCSPDQLRLATAKQLEVRQLSARLEALEGEVRKPKEGLDSHSPAMKVVLETARQLLRFIQDKEYERVGDPVTHRFLARFVKEYARPARGFSDEAREALLGYRWPGNIRELRNVVERASIICPQERVEISHLGMAEAPINNAPRIGAPLSLDELEKAHIGAVLATAGTLDQAAKTLGIDASTLYRKRKQYNLQEALVRNNFVTLDLGLKLRQTLGDQLLIMLSEKSDPAALEASRQRYLELLEEGIAQEPPDETHGFKKAKADYLSFMGAYEVSADPTRVLSGNDELTEKFNLLRNGLIT
eukprot:gene5985-5856_t